MKTRYLVLIVGICLAAIAVYQFRYGDLRPDRITESVEAPPIGAAYLTDEVIRAHRQHLVIAIIETSNEDFVSGELHFPPDVVVGFEATIKEKGPEVAHDELMRSFVSRLTTIMGQHPTVAESRSRELMRLVLNNKAPSMAVLHGGEDNPLVEAILAGQDITVGQLVNEISPAWRDELAQRVHAKVNK